MNLPEAEDKSTDLNWCPLFDLELRAWIHFWILKRLLFDAHIQKSLFYEFDILILHFDWWVLKIFCNLFMYLLRILIQIRHVQILLLKKLQTI